MNIKFYHKVCILYFVFFLNLFSSNIVLKSSVQEYPVTSVEILEDAESLIPAEKLLLEHKKEFRKIEAPFFDFSFSKSAFWIKFSVENRMRKYNEIIIETPYFPNLSVQFLIYSENGQLEKRFLHNYVRHKNLNLILDIPKDSKKIIVLKCYPEGSPMRIPINLWSKKGFSQKIIKEYSAIFLYFGIMIFLSFNSIILGIFFKARAFSAFGVYIFTFTLLLFYSLEVPRLFGISTLTLIKATGFTFFLNMLSLLIFTQIYFSIKSRKLVIIYSIFEFFTIASMVTVLISKKIVDGFYSYTFNVKFTLLVTLLLFITFLLHIKKNRKESIYFFASLSPYLMAFTVKGLEMIDVLPATTITESSILIGGFTSVILFYFLIGRRIRNLYKQREESQLNIINIQKEHNLNLEKLVNERTTDLEEKNSQLEKQTKQMEDRKEILHSLILISSAIQRHREIDGTISFMFDNIGELIDNPSYGVIINGEREAIINSAYFYSTSQSEKDILINSQDTLLSKSTLLNFENDSYNIIRRYIFPVEDELWSIIPFFSTKGEVLGKLLIKKKDIQEYFLEIITVFIDQMTVITENIKLTTSLEKMANTDSLTGAYNRNYFDEQFKHCSDLNIKHNINFSIISLDINGLKKINDFYGHEEGDRLIISAVNILKTVTRSSDILARVGGDEFIILCPSTEISGAEILAERIKKLQNETKVILEIHKNNSCEEIQVHMSIGISSTEIIDVDNIIKDADQKMYADKKEYYKSKEKYRTHT